MRDIRILIGTLVAFILGVCAFGQVSTGTIVVAVQDPSGAVVPGADVTLLHVSTGQTRRGQTNETGQFRATFLPIGEYTLRTGSKGFKSNTTTGLLLSVDS
jgi:hypothetical protein